MKTLQAGTTWFLVAGMLMLALCAFSGQASANNNPWGPNQFNEVYRNITPSEHTDILLLPGQYMFSFYGWDWDENKNLIPNSVNYGYLLYMSYDGNLYIVGGELWDTDVWSTGLPTDPDNATSNFAILAWNGTFYLQDINDGTPGGVKWNSNIIGSPSTTSIALSFPWYQTNALLVYSNGYNLKWSSFDTMDFPHSGCHDAACLQYWWQLGSEATVLRENYYLDGNQYNGDQVCGTIAQCANFCAQDTANRCVGYRMQKGAPSKCQLLNDLPGTGRANNSFHSGYIKGRCAPGETDHCRAY